MKWRTLLMAGVLVLGAETVAAQDVMPGMKDGKRIPPKAPVTQEVTPGAARAALMADIAKEVAPQDTEAVINFVDMFYSLNGIYKDVLRKEQELRMTQVSNEEQKELMKEYLRLLGEEKELARKVIDTIKEDLKGHESRLIQVMAKVFRVGDPLMKKTVFNVQIQVKKHVRHQMFYAQGGERAFYMNMMRFLDTYFR